ncbi:putative thymidine kinase [Trypanosoma grayi]|uniref:putative thymidine kinase n=1 Tax=Trypanosoma grayi TaxID=71804 RepID=UPI0004F46821|nr:putative thymidine kinase [Trypanosoma grayi]KEG10205.1 putative thymidine kinase [Trypanosoma grayi]
MAEMTENHGHIELIIGPMFAGKTTELMRRVRRELFARRSCYVIKHSRDVRYNRESVSSHDKVVLGATAAVAELCATIARASPRTIRWCLAPRQPSRSYARSATRGVRTTWWRWTKGSSSTTWSNSATPPPTPARP